MTVINNRHHVPCRQTPPKIVAKAVVTTHTSYQTTISYKLDNIMYQLKSEKITRKFLADYSAEKSGNTEGARTPDQKQS